MDCTNSPLNQVYDTNKCQPQKLVTSSKTFYFQQTLNLAKISPILKFF
jgi:hypothetical protein